MTDSSASKRRLSLALVLAFALAIAGCSGDSSSSDDTNASTGSGDADGNDAGGDSSGDGDANTGDDSSDGDDDDPDAGDSGDGAPDNDDAAEILGNPDLDTDDLPDEVADALDSIDDIVSIGDCQSETIGLGFTAPEGWQCRVLDQAIGGLDGFTLFTEGNQLNITIGTPSPIAPCEVLQMCDTAESIQLSDQFPETQLMEFAGTVTIWGRHISGDAELIITNFSALTEEELTMIRTVLDSTTEVG